MAFKPIETGIQFKKLTDLKEGESLIGYMLGVEKSTKIEGGVNLRMRVDGKATVVNTAGNVKYMALDGKLALGQNTKITRVADRKVKGKKSSSYSVEQDADDVLEGAETLATTTSTPLSDKSANIKEKIANMKANG